MSFDIQLTHTHTQLVVFCYVLLPVRDVSICNLLTFSLPGPFKGPKDLHLLPRILARF